MRIGPRQSSPRIPEWQRLELTTLDVGLLQRYWLGMASDDEVQAVETWFDAKPGRREWYDQFQRGLASGRETTLAPEEVARRTAAIMDVIDRPVYAGRAHAGWTHAGRWNRRSGNSRWTYQPWAWFGAAMLGIVLAVGAIRVTRGNSHTPAAMVAAERTYVTGTGERATLTLIDGTRVTLAPRSVLRLADRGHAGRRVTLEGEAYFDVANGTASPFIVQTGNVRTEVLGTKFMVQRYPGAARVRVAVRAGKVSVRSDIRRDRAMAGVTVTAGYVAEASDSDGTKVIPAGQASYTGWLDDRLVFHNAPASEVLSTVTRWYGYEFRVSDPALVRKNLTMEVSTESAQDALATLKILLNVDMNVDGHTITLVPRRGTSSKTHGRRDDALTLYSSEVGR